MLTKAEAAIAFCKLIDYITIDYVEGGRNSGDAWGDLISLGMIAEGIHRDIQFSEEDLETIEGAVKRYEEG